MTSFLPIIHLKLKVFDKFSERDFGVIVANPKLVTLIELAPESINLNNVEMSVP